MVEVLNIDKNLFDIEAKLDIFESIIEPKDKVDLKITIQKEIDILKAFLKLHPEEDESGDIYSSLEDFEEILN